MSRLVALAVSGMLVSFAPAMAFDNTATNSEQYEATAVQVPAPAPTSVVLQTAQEAVVGAPVYSAVPFSSAGLGATGIAFGVIGVAATAAIVGLAANSDSSSSTN